MDRTDFTELWFLRETSDYLKRHGRDSSIVEIGIGKGEYLYLYPRGINIVLGDRRIEKELTMQISNGPSVCQLDAEKLPFKDGSFAILIAHKLIAHLSNVTKFLGEIHRILSSNGTVLLSTVVRGPLGFGIHKNERGERVLEKLHVSEFKSVESLVDLFTNGRRFQLVLAEKKPIIFPIKKYLPRKIVKRHINILDKLLIPLPLYYYDVLLIFKKCNG